MIFSKKNSFPIFEIKKRKNNSLKPCRHLNNLKTPNNARIYIQQTTQKKSPFFILQEKKTAERKSLVVSVGGQSDFFENFSIPVARILQNAHNV